MLLMPGDKLAECPNPDSVVVQQGASIPRPSGLVDLTCLFRVPLGKLSQYEWLTKDNRQIFTYKVSYFLQYYKFYLLGYIV